MFYNCCPACRFLSPSNASITLKCSQCGIVFLYVNNLSPEGWGLNTHELSHCLGAVHLAYTKYSFQLTTHQVQVMVGRTAGLRRHSRTVTICKFTLCSNCDRRKMFAVLLITISAPGRSCLRHANVANFPCHHTWLLGIAV